MSGRVRDLSAPDLHELALRLLAADDDVPRWFVYELIHHHEEALASLDAHTLRDLGRGMDGWGEVDPFACYLSGVAWRAGAVSDEEIHRWAASDDRWWRRAAVVSAVPLNVEARGGHGDAARTLAICDRLRHDPDDMVVKAISWALRSLVPRDREAVERYLEAKGDQLAPRVRREVGNKLGTGRKNPESG